MNKQKIIEGIVWNDHAGYGMCLLPNGPSAQGEVILIENDFPTEDGPGHKQTQLLPNAWHGMKVRIIMEVIDDNVSAEHKEFYDHSLWSKSGPRWEDEEKANYTVDALRAEFRKRLYRDTDNNPGHEGDDYPHVCQRCEENGPRCVCVKEIDRIYDYTNGEVKDNGKQ